MRLSVLAICCVLMISLVACNAGADQAAQKEDGALQVVATTNIVGDVVSQVGGDAIQLAVLLPPGTDPHSFQPTPQDMALVADAQVIFSNGAGLEAFMQALLENSGSQARQVEVSQEIILLVGSSHAEPADGDDHADEDELGGDPHVWLDPKNVMLWVDQIERTLTEVDPQNAALYQQNAAAYRQELAELDQWIVDQVSQIPPSHRKLVTDHQLFAYFAEGFGFEQIGAIVPGYSTLSEPSARELALLEDAISALDVQAVFVGNTVNPSLAQRVAKDTGVKLVFLYTGSLTDAAGPAATYLEYMRFNVNAIVEALR
jgi:ABC-type Zn uptake system ZnuABC Zn-binding protein ZnuA